MEVFNTTLILKKCEKFHRIGKSGDYSIDIVSYKTEE